VGLSEKTQKSTNTGSTTAQYGWQTNPGSAAYDTLAHEQFHTDPTIGARLGEAQRTLKNTVTSPTGGYVTPAIRDAIMRSGNRELMQQSGAQTRAGIHDVNQLNFARDAAVAQGTAPVLTQTGGTSQGTGTVKESQSPLGTALQVAGAAAPMSM